MFRKLAGLTAIAGLFFAGAASAAITDTAHDFRDGAGFGNDAWNTTGEICAVCHTPHTGDAAVTDAPLWDHETVAVAQSYSVYDDTGLEGTVGQPASLTRLCLSCHDGTVSLDSFGAEKGTATGNELTAASTAFFGTDLSDDHPVSVTYEGTTAGLFAAPQDAVVQLFGTGTVECASCHEVHNEANVDNGQYLLVLSNAASDLCLSCHNK
jgi:mono/diheme cytochrome c family protein